MAWEERERGGSYYYRTHWSAERGRPVKEYVGTGYVAELAAQLDEADRERRAAEKARDRWELERMQSLAATLLELERAAEVLARAELIAGGYHRHKGEWRRVRSA